MRVLQDWCLASEEVICRYWQRQEIENNKWDQYKEAVCILKEDMTATTPKLKEESRLREKAEKAKAGLTTGMTALREQMDKAKADVVAEFKAS